MIAIGIGCYWFAQREGEDEDFDPREFLTHVKDALESVDNVSDVEVFTRGDSITVSGSSYAQHGDDENFFPIFSNMRISFQIYMPERLIERYGRGRASVEAERFAVEIVYGHGMPVAYVNYELEDDADNLDEYSPS